MTSIAIEVVQRPIVVSKADIIRRFKIASRLIWLAGTFMAIILAVICITLYTQNEQLNSGFTVFVVVTSVVIALFVATSLSCIHSAKKRALAVLATQEGTPQRQPRQRRVTSSNPRGKSSSHDMDGPPPYDSLFDIHGTGIVSPMGGFDVCASSTNAGFCESTNNCSGGGDSGGGCTTSSSSTD